MKLKNLRCPFCGTTLLIDYAIRVIKQPDCSYICVPCGAQFRLGLESGVLYIEDVIEAEKCPLCGGGIKKYEHLLECRICLQQFSLEENRLYIIPERKMLHEATEALVKLEEAKALFDRLNTRRTQNYLKLQFKGYRITTKTIPIVLAILCLAAKRIPITINMVRYVSGKKVVPEMMHRWGDKGLLSVDISHQFYIWFVKGKFLELAMKLAREVAESET